MLADIQWNAHKDRIENFTSFSLIMIIISVCIPKFFIKFASNLDCIYLLSVVE